jgi:hypothetical protein
MPKPIDLKVGGKSFEEVLKRMIATPPPPTSKKAQRKAPRKKR